MHSFHPNFPPSFVCALGAGMLEKLDIDLLQADQNGNEDIVLRYIAVEGGMSRVAQWGLARGLSMHDIPNTYRQ